MAQELSLLEAIYTTRAVRRFEDRPVPLELVNKVLEAATMGPSGRNSQQWHFVVVDDPAIKEQIGEQYRLGYLTGRGELPSEEEDPSIYLAQHMGEAPVLVLVCAPQRQGPPGPRRLTLVVYASLFPAIQNMLLAARAYGLAGVLTVNHESRTPEIKAILGLPEQMNIFAIVPLGFPAQKHGKKTRKPVAAVSSYNAWGTPLPGK
jgi:nitroreductase